MRTKFISPFEVWQRWFAWYPVTTVHGERVWWEYVERKLRMYAYDSVWEYR